MQRSTAYFGMDSNGAASLSTALWERFVEQHIRVQAFSIDGRSLSSSTETVGHRDVDHLSFRMTVLLYGSLLSEGDEMTGRKAIMHAAVTALGGPQYDRVAVMLEAAIDADMRTAST